MGPGHEPPAPFTFTFLLTNENILLPKAADTGSAFYRQREQSPTTSHNRRLTARQPVQFQQKTFFARRRTPQNQTQNAAASAPTGRCLPAAGSTHWAPPAPRSSPPSPQRYSTCLCDKRIPLTYAQLAD